MPDGSKLPSDGVLALGLSALVAATFAPSIRFDLVLDDHWVLADNGYLRTRGDLWALLDGTAVRAGVPDAFRPVSALFDVVAYRAFGLSAPLHHAVSLALAAAASVLAFFYLRRRGIPKAAALAAGALFSTAAVHAEVVAVVSYREDLLAFVAAMTALLLLEDPRAGPGRGLGAAAVFFCACQAKLSVAPLALLAPAAQLGGLGRPLPRRRAAATGIWLALALALALCIRIGVLGELSGQGEDARLLSLRHGWAMGVASGIRGALAGTFRLLVPVGLSPLYPRTAAGTTDPAVLLGGTGLLLAAGLLTWGLVRGKTAPAAYALGGYALALTPVLQFVPLRHVEADRFLFVPSFFAAVGLSALAFGRPGRRFPTAAAAALGAYTVIQGAAAQAHARTFRSDRRIARVAAVRAPGAAAAVALRGLDTVAEIERIRATETPVPPRMWARTAADCRAAVGRDPREGLGWVCLGRLRMASGDPHGAWNAFARALATGITRRDRVLVALAQAARHLGPGPETEAMEQIAHDVEARPYAAGLAAAYGRLLHERGEAASALAMYRRARRLAPERWDVLAWTLELLLDLGDAGAARRALATHFDRWVAAVPPSVRHAVYRRLRLARSHRLDRSAPLRPSGEFSP